MRVRLSRSGSWRGRERGSVLVVTIWLVAILGMVVLGALQTVSVEARGVAAARGMVAARSLAESGLQLGLHPEVKPGDPVLTRESDEGEKLEVRLTLEEGKLNPNTILLSQDTDPVKRLFLHWGLSAPDAAAVTDALADWVDQDGLVRMRGAEDKAYGRPGMPANRPFQSLEEMLAVRGMEKVAAAQPRWRESFTLWTWGQVDLHSADPDVLAAVTGVDLAKARSIVTKISGRDGIRQTADDLQFTSMEEATRALGLTKSPLMTHQGVTRRIESRGTVGIYRKRLLLVAREFQILSTGELPEEPFEP